MIFIFIGVFVFLIVAIWGSLTYQFISRSATAQGKVIRLNSGGSHPEIKFTTGDGKEVEYPQSGLIFGYKTGDTVEVLYDSQNPKKASINSFGALWGFPALIFVLGLLFIIVGFFQKI